MKDTKIEFKIFTIVQWEQEQNYLRMQHKNGWKFVKVNFIGLYHFERCEPEDMVYQLDYNPEGIEHKDEYIKMFHDCGWEYLQDYFGYSYFRKAVSEMNGDEKIFCDNDFRAEMLKKVFKRRAILLCVLLVPQIFLQSRLDNSLYCVLIGLFIAGSIFLIILLLFAIYFRKY